MMLTLMLDEVDEVNIVDAAKPAENRDQGKDGELQEHHEANGTETSGGGVGYQIRMIEKRAQDRTTYHLPHYSGLMRHFGLSMMSNSDLTTFKPFDHHKRYTTMLDILWCAICSAHSNSNSDQLVRTCDLIACGQRGRIERRRDSRNKRHWSEGRQGTQLGSWAKALMDSLPLDLDQPGTRTLMEEPMCKTQCAKHINNHTAQGNNNWVLLVLSSMLESAKQSACMMHTRFTELRHSVQPPA